MGQNFAFTTRLAQVVVMNIPMEALKFRISFPQKTVRNCSHHLDNRHDELCSLETQNKSGLSLVLFDNKWKENGSKYLSAPHHSSAPTSKPFSEKRQMHLPMRSSSSCGPERFCIFQGLLCTKKGAFQHTYCARVSWRC